MTQAAHHIFSLPGGESSDKNFVSMNTSYLLLTK